MASLIHRSIDEEYISLRELAKEIHADPRTIKNYMAEMGWHFPILRKDKDVIINYIIKRKEEKKSGNRIPQPVKSVNQSVSEQSEKEIESTVKEKSPVEKLIEEKKDYGYHVSIRGRLGWIVVHIGPRDEMEAWHRLFLRNDIESKVDENQKLLMAYDIGLSPKW